MKDFIFHLSVLCFSPIAICIFGGLSSINFFRNEYWILLVLWSWFLSEKQIMKFKLKYMKLIWAKTHIYVCECVPKSSKHTISALRWLIIIMIVCFSSREKRATPKLNLLRHCSNIIPYVKFELYRRSS